jgi:hypothetical protein
MKAIEGIDLKPGMIVTDIEYGSTMLPCYFEVLGTDSEENKLCLKFISHQNGLSKNPYSEVNGVTKFMLTHEWYLIEG